MDWSLVLTSQGIETVIEHVPEGEGWLLLVEERDHERALAAIAAYRRENRGWAWRHRLQWSGLVFHWGALYWCWVMVLWYWASTTLGTGVTAAGVMDSLAVRRGEWWRLFTAISLHADLGHLAANVSTGLLVLGLAMARYGPGWALLASFLAGAGGNLLGLLVRLRPYEGLGASGMVMGGLGLLAVASVALWRRSPHAPREVVTGVLGGGLLFVLIGVDPGSDVVAHAGGFVVGVLEGGLLNLASPRWLKAPQSGRWAGVLAALLAVATWALALGAGAGHLTDPGLGSR